MSSGGHKKIGAHLRQGLRAYLMVRGTILALVAVLLAGCVVEPAGPPGVVAAPGPYYYGAYPPYYAPAVGGVDFTYVGGGRRGWCCHDGGRRWR